jgi:steroid 5-alpha reductase family enzyme
MSLLHLIIGVTGLALFLFTLAWIAAKTIDNYSIVDALWALSFGLFALFLVLYGPGHPTRKFLFGGMYFIWSARLGIYLTARIFSHLDVEDSRYRKLREEYGEHVPFRFFLFFIYQALSVVLLLGPLFIGVLNPAPVLSPLEVIGAFVWFLGILGESVADAQLSNFRKNPENKGGVCEDGLWYYSRHPNYFFECVVWLGFGIFVFASPSGWTTLYAPAILWFLILKVTGVPMAEKTSLLTRGEKYRKYQETTSAVVPLPKREAHRSH